MSLMRLQIDDWWGLSGIDPFDDVVDFSSIGLWISCTGTEGPIVALILGYPTDPLSATVCGSPGHVVIDEKRFDPDCKKFQLFVRLKFFPLPQ